MILTDGNQVMRLNYYFKNMSINYSIEYYILIVVDAMIKVNWWKFKNYYYIYIYSYGEYWEKIIKKYSRVSSSRSITNSSSNSIRK